MISADLILPDLRATSKKQAFRSMAEAVAPLVGSTAEAVFDALMARERIGTTGIGGGVAIPHVKLEGLENIFGVLARLDSPVDYDAIDGGPVDLIFMMLVPAESKTTQHLKVLAQISRFLKDCDTCETLRGCTERKKIEDLIAEWTRSQAA